MAITMQEFRAAMEIYGAVEVPEQTISRDKILVPCFNVAGINFLHDGLDCVIQRGNEVPKEIMIRAMAEFDEEYPGKENFWYTEIYSIRAVLTVVTMLEEKYCKETVNEIINETYKKLFSYSLIKENVKVPFKNQNKFIFKRKWREFYRLIVEHDKVVNPFSKNIFMLKDPIEYLDKMRAEVSFCDDETIKRVDLILESNDGASNTKFTERPESGWMYATNGWNDAEKHSECGITAMIHYYDNGLNGKPIDEVIRLFHTTGSIFRKYVAEDIDLNISLMTGLAWKRDRNQATPVTNEQLEIMIKYLKISIERTKKMIIDEMIQK